MRTIDYDKAAEVLVDAAYYGDEAAAERWGLSERTIKRYRARMGEDDILSLSVREKRQLIEKDWAAVLPAAIRAGADFIRRAAEQGDPSNPDMVHAVAGGMKLVAEIQFAKQMLDARFGVMDVRDSGDAGADRPQIESVVANGEYSVIDGEPLAAQP